MKQAALLLVLWSSLAFAGPFSVYPGSKLVPAMSSESADVYMTQDAYEKVVAHYARTGKVERNMDKGGRRTLFSFDGGVEMVVWEVKEHAVSISVTK